MQDPVNEDSAIQDPAIQAPVIQDPATQDPVNPDPMVTEGQSVQQFRRRCREEGSIFWVREGALGVFDPQVVQELEAANFADLTMMDGFADVIRGRASEPVTWNRLRSAWLGQMRNLTNTDGLRALAERMIALLDAQVGRPQDLVWLAERAAVEPLVPAIIAGLKPASLRRVVREVHTKVAWVLSDVDPHRSPLWHRPKMWICQLIAGLEVRRELQRRAAGKRPRQQDLADPVVDLLPELGIDRAVDAVTSLLTAITGSPGAAAACMLFELNRQHEWRARLEEELAAIPLDKLCEAPVRLAPVTTRFVKEILRIWSSPPVVSRHARTDINLERASLKQGQHYVISSFLIHHDERSWSDPEKFDPDRWLADGRRDQCPHGSYAPFGWAPKSCIGANLGMAQLVILAHLLCTRYRVDVINPEHARIAVASVVRPMNFDGTVARR